MKLILSIILLLVSQMALAEKWHVVEVRGAELLDENTSRYSVSFGDSYIALSREVVTDINQEAIKALIETDVSKDLLYPVETTALPAPTRKQIFGLMDSIQHILEASSGKVSSDAVSYLYKDPESALNKLEHLRAVFIAAGK